MKYENLAWKNLENTLNFNLTLRWTLNINILDHETNFFKLNSLEELDIHISDNMLNSHNETSKLNKTYFIK